MEKLFKLGKGRERTSFCILGLFSFAPATLSSGSEEGRVREVRGSESRAPQLPVREPAEGLPGVHRLHPTKIPFSGSDAWKWAGFAACLWLVLWLSGRGRRVFSGKAQLGGLPRAQSAPRTGAMGVGDVVGGKLTTPKASKTRREII